MATAKGTCTQTARGARTQTAKGACTQTAKGGLYTDSQGGLYTDRTKGACTQTTKGACTQTTKGLYYPDNQAGIPMNGDDESQSSESCSSAVSGRPLWERLYAAERRRALETQRGAYRELVTELFFLQNGGNLSDYEVWRRRPNTLLACYLRSEALSPPPSHQGAVNGDGVIQGDLFLGDASTPQLSHPAIPVTEVGGVHAPFSLHLE